EPIATFCESLFKRPELVIYCDSKGLESSRCRMKASVTVYRRHCTLYNLDKLVRRLDLLFRSVHRDAFCDASCIFFTAIAEDHISDSFFLPVIHDVACSKIVICRHSRKGHLERFIFLKGESPARHFKLIR